MAIYDQIRVPMYDITVLIQKKTAVLVILLAVIVIQIVFVIRCLHDRII